MKRVANNVALQTVFFTLGWDQKIRIIDRRHYAGSDHVTLLYEGLRKDFGWKTDLPDISVTRVEHSAIHKIEIEDDVMVFWLDTVGEEY